MVMKVCLLSEFAIKTFESPELKDHFQIFLTTHNIGAKVS